MVQKDFFDSFKYYKNIYSSALLVYLKDLDDKILVCSDSFVSFVNQGEKFMNEKTLEGKAVSEIFETDAKKIIETDRQIKESRKRVTVDVHLQARNGKQKWLKLEKMPYYDSQEKLTGILVFAFDITEQISIKLQAEQLYIILNAHLVTEEILKNTSDLADFPQLLSEALSSAQLFKAVMIEYLSDQQDNPAQGYASWHSPNGKHHRVQTHDNMCEQCRNLISKRDSAVYFVKEHDSACPWSAEFEHSKIFVSKLQYGSKLYGTLCVKLDETWLFESQTNELLNQLAGKIAFGFYTLQTQAQIAQIQNDMERRLSMYKIALDSINDGVWDWNLETNKVFFSDKYYTMLGYLPGEFEPSFDSWKRLVHPEDLEEALRIINLHFESKQEAYEVEFRMKTKSNRYQWILGRGKVYERDQMGNAKKIVGTHVDISELKQKEEELAEKNQQLKSVNEELRSNNEEIIQMNEELEKLYSDQEALNEQLNRILKLMGQIALFETSEEEFLEEALDLAMNLVPTSSRGRIRMLKEQSFKLLATVGLPHESIQAVELNSESVCQMNNSKIISKDDIHNYYLFQSDQPPSNLLKLNESIITPIKWNNVVIGSIEIDNLYESDVFKISDIKKMDSFANLLSVFYRLRKYINEEGKFQTDLILTLVKALEYYDEYTRGHSERVARWSVQLAKAVGVPLEGQKKIYYASLMHDIGKIFVQQSVLNKISPLTEQEYQLIQIHPAKSAELINKVEGMESFARIVRHHHEKYNGKGYPDGLTGKAIPYFSRIIAVADAYDAMTSERPYRRPLSSEEAANELRRCKGSQFDPTLVDPFIEQVILRKTSNSDEPR
ncbi:MAG TPA: PAS domain-containing protein [Thermotogota bacterium]|nr:PAS domain-containing protein [Thermotogota bacterium]HRW34846.1 PAS domain-containing protein [Thermotogota bacterium]